ncbi:MAG: hypothetical protein ACJAZ9_002003 [Neolewinella sp.]|jgi:hypothetical protein
MPELDDHKTDELFQVGAGRHDFKYEPAAWEQMESLLDADDDSRRRRIAWFVGLGVLLALLLAFIGYQNMSATFAAVLDGPIATEQQLGDNAADNAAGSGVPPVAPSSISDAATDNKRTPSTESAPNGQETVDVKDAQTVNGTSGVTGANRNTNPSGPVRTVPTLTSTSGDGVDPPVSVGISVIDKENDPEAAANGPITLENSANSNTGIPESEIALVNNLATVAISPLNGLPLTGVSFNRPLKEVKIEAPAKVEFATASKSGFAVGVSAGMVLGNVQAEGFAKLRPRFGAKIDYRLNNKFSVGTGAYLNQVCYRASGDEYKASAGFWTDDVKPETVQADCNVLEIPFSLTFHPRGNDKSGFYFAGGLTSYLMLTEQFTFNYGSDEPVGAKQDWREENTNQHFLGLGHFNFGYQRKSGKKSAFQVESFVHLPLQGIGHGQIKLFTVGASVNYTLDFRKRK